MLALIKQSAGFNKPILNRINFGRFSLSVPLNRQLSSAAPPASDTAFSGKIPGVKPVGILHHLGDLPLAHPKPVRSEFTGSKKLTTEDLKALPVRLGYHYQPRNLSDHIAYRLVKLLRLPTDIFFKKRYLSRAVMLETIAAVPGFVAAMMRHLTSLRLMSHDGGWIAHLLEEATNERMHLMTFVQLLRPSVYERTLIATVQVVFVGCYSIMYTLFPRCAHRMTGYLEEEAVISYTSFLEELKKGNIEDVPAPELARWYWNLYDQAKLSDVVMAIRFDEAAHRDVNHVLSCRIQDNQTDLRKPYEPKL
ncbi:hypothetical protein MIR68_010757 [Amoeboaphelidium protococcarum]|nr:hypothetical protein MIR68_010757 [Amoeboaphelidium protococcarum]